MIDTIIICSIFGVFIMASFGFGMNFAMKVMKGQEVKLELPNPIKAINEHKEKKETEKIMDKLDIVAENIDNYDGTGAYQKEIPR